MTDGTSDKRVYGGRYEIQSKIARGGMADVYRARDNLLDRPVALKVLFAELSVDPSFVERFRREAQNAARLSHPNIVSVYDWGEEASTYFIVMELVEGESVSSLLRQKGALLPDRAATIGSETASALAFAHKNGVVHRDVKPGNILIDSRGSVKVTDFGIARARNTTENLTQTGAVMGTATYFSPEQAQGLAVDQRSDVYSLGVVLYEMVAGTPPFKGDNPVTIAYKHVRETPPPLAQVAPAVPRAYQAIVDHAMAKAPGARYASADELRNDLERFRRGQPVNYQPAADATQAVGAYTQAQRAYGSQTQAVPIQRNPEPQKTNRLKGFFTAVVAVLALLGILGFLYFGTDFGNGDDAPPVVVANVVDKNVDEATKQLKADGFEVRITRETNDKAEDTVISQDPAAQASVPRGSTIRLTVSDGPEPTSLPNVVSQTFEQAQSRLTALGLKVNRTSAPSESIDEGKVISQNPSSGSRVVKGDTITLTVSTGRQKVQIPDLEGFTREAAVRELNDDGLNVSTQTEDSPRPNGTVLRTDPPAGTEVARGSTVTIIVASGGSGTTTTTSPGNSGPGNGNGNNDD